MVTWSDVVSFLEKWIFQEGRNNIMPNQFC